jgi:SprT protein
VKQLIPTASVPSHLVSIAEKRTKQALEIGKRKLNIEIPFEGVQFFHKSATAGFVMPMKNNVVYLNRDLLESNIPHFVDNTIPHEVAHLFAFAVAMKQKRLEPAHGKTWKKVMRNVYGLEPEVFHKLDTSISPTGRKKYKYICRCQKHLVGSRVHNRIETGSIYKCRYCKTDLTFLSKID